MSHSHSLSLISHQLYLFHSNQAILKFDGGKNRKNEKKNNKKEKSVNKLNIFLVY